MKKIVDVLILDKEIMALYSKEKDPEQLKQALAPMEEAVSKFSLAMEPLQKAASTQKATQISPEIIESWKFLEKTFNQAVLKPSKSTKIKKSCST